MLAMQGPHGIECTVRLVLELAKALNDRVIAPAPP
jgi:hypothetical protein